MTTRVPRFGALHALSAVALSALAFIAAPPPAGATTITVTTTLDEQDGSIVDGDISLRDALVAAASQDTVYAPAGVYTLSMGFALPINTDLTVRGDGPDKTIVQAAATPRTANHRVFETAGSPDVTFHDLTIRHGDVSGAGERGGGIYCDDGVALFYNCELNLNAARIGGAIATDNASIGLFGCRLFNNLALDAQGGIDFHSPGPSRALFLSETWIHGSTRSAIRTGANSSCIMGGCHISDTFANSAIFNGGSMLMGSCVVSGTMMGSGIVNAGVLTAVNTTIAGNHGDYYDGGGLVNTDGSTVNLNGCAIVRNTATVNAGGVWTGLGANFNVSNSIIALNRDLDGDERYDDVYGQFHSDGYNIIGDAAGSAGFQDGFNGDQIGDTFNPIDPLLGPLTDNRGPVPTCALLPGSPAIDRASPFAPGGGSGAAEETDARGLARPVDADGDGTNRADVGPYEAGGADIAISKTSLPASATGGTSITHVIRVENHGPEDAEGVTVVDVYSALDVDYVSSYASQGSCSHGSAQVICDFGDLAAGQSALAMINFSLRPHYAGDLPNTATLTPTTPDITSLENEAVAYTAVTLTPRLSLTPDLLNFGDREVNAGPQGAANILIHNAGTRDLTFSGPGVALTGPDAAHFALSNVATDPLGPGATAPFTVAFAPTSAGLKSAEVAITTNDPVCPTVTVPLWGAGVATQGSVTLSQLIEYLLGLRSLSPQQKQTADFNGDSEIDAADVVELVNQSAPPRLTEDEALALAERLVRFAAGLQTREDAR